MSETDDQAPRRPPTIELSATEVDGAAENAARAEAAADATAGEHATGDSSGPASASSAPGVASYIFSALIGALVMAGGGAALWFTGVIPARETAPVATAPPGPSVAASSVPAVPEPKPPPGSPSTSAPATSAPETSAPSTSAPPAAQMSPVTPDLTVRLDKIERAIEAPRSDPALGSRIGELAGQTKTLGDNVAALTRRVDDIAAGSQTAGKQADMALKAAEAAKIASDAASKNGAPRSDLDALASRITTLESTVKGLAVATAPLTSAGANDRAARLTIATEALRAAAERGAPYQAELSAVQALGVDQKATAPLESFAASGVPSAAALARELEALIPALQHASEPRSGDASFVERLKSNAQKLVRITPLNAPPGNDPQAVLDRIRLDAARADIGTALTNLNALPDAATSLAADWSKKAAAREAALAASRKIAADALAALAQSSPR